MDRKQLSSTLRDLYNEDTGAMMLDLTEDLQLVADLGLDSVDMVSLVMQVERHFRIRLSHEELKQVVTVGNLLDVISSNLDSGVVQNAA